MRNRLRVACLTLDQCQRLQHRVVQMCRNVGSLLTSDAFSPFELQVARQPDQPRSDDECYATHGQQYGAKHVVDSS